MEKKISENELENLQKLTGEFNNAKTQLGDLTLQKHLICAKVDELRTEFREMEAELSKTYGEDAVINLETGIVTKKEKEAEGDSTPEAPAKK
jgi:hypothetical protein